MGRTKKRPSLIFWATRRIAVLVLLMGAGSNYAENIDCSTLVTIRDVTKICDTEITLSHSSLPDESSVFLCHREITAVDPPDQRLSFTLREQSDPKGAARLFKMQSRAYSGKEQFKTLEFADAAHRFRDRGVTGNDEFHTVHFLIGKYQALLRVDIKNNQSLCTPEQATKIAEVIANRLIEPN